MPSLSVRRATPADLGLLRDLRLRALLADPSAFGSTHAREVLFEDSVWLDRISASVWLFAVVAGVPAGLMALTPRPGSPGVGDVTAVWVVPEFRGRGVGELLLAALCGEARRVGLERLSLFVVEGNVSAERLYRRLGFVPTGVSKPLGHSPDLSELEMVLVL